MPRGDEKHGLIYEGMVNILGADYVSDDPAVMEAYSCDFRSVSTFTVTGGPEFVALPEGIEDI